MSVEELALQLPRVEKLRLMEALWTDMIDHAETTDAPEWHRAALAETERRLAAGTERVLDWKDAKRQLLSEK